MTGWPSCGNRRAGVRHRPGRPRPARAGRRGAPYAGTRPRAPGGPERRSWSRGAEPGEAGHPLPETAALERVCAAEPPGSTSATPRPPGRGGGRPGTSSTGRSPRRTRVGARRRRCWRGADAPAVAALRSAHTAAPGARRRAAGGGGGVGRAVVPHRPAAGARQPGRAAEALQPAGEDAATRWRRTASPRVRRRC